jgi:hypothetical protein
MLRSSLYHCTYNALLIVLKGLVKSYIGGLGRTYGILTMGYTYILWNGIGVRFVFWHEREVVRTLAQKHFTYFYPIRDMVTIDLINRRVERTWKEGKKGMCVYAMDVPRH